MTAEHTPGTYENFEDCAAKSHNFSSFMTHQSVAAGKKSPDGYWWCGERGESYPDCIKYVPQEVAPFPWPLVVLCAIALLFIGIIAGMAFPGRKP